MKNLIIVNAGIVSDGAVKNNFSVKISGGKITGIGQNLPLTDSDEVIDAGGSYLSAGFIDLHVHGGGGSDFMDSTAGDFETITTFHASHGTTGMLATTLTCPDEELFEAIDCYNSFVSAPRRGSSLLGLHLEGPYFSYGQRGAQDPAYLKNPSRAHYEPILNRTNHIKRWSAAPELDGAMEFAAECRKRGIVLSMAHTECTAAEAYKAYENGYKLLTHFYSCMNGVVRKNCYRVAGLIETGYLIDGLKVEIIADGSHLPPELLQLVFKIKGAENICLITDCSSAGGTCSGSAKIGSRKNGQPVIVKDNVAFIADMSGFAGSVATADKLLQTMLNNTDAGICKAVEMLTLTPAKILGLQDRKGRIKKGYDADIVIFDYSEKKITVKNVLINGIKIK